MNRRGFLGAILAAAVAPAIIRVDSLMRVRPYGEPELYGSWMVQMLNELDQTIHMPLGQTIWARDIDLPQNVKVYSSLAEVERDFGMPRVSFRDRLLRRLNESRSH